MLCCFNNGLSMRRVDANYVAQLGEVLFRDDPVPTEAQLTAAFPSYVTSVIPMKAGAMLAAGCQSVSTSTPSLNGTYPIDPASQSKIQATALYIQVNGKFPGGRASLPWADAAGAIHVFSTTAQFMAFATAIGDFVTELEMVMIGEAASLPSQPVTIS